MFLQSKDLWDAIVDGKPADPGIAPIEPQRDGNDEEAIDMARQQNYQEELRTYNEKMEALNQWRRKDGKAMNYIALSVDRSNANLIYHLTSGSEAWTTLKSHHQATTLGNKLRTKKEAFFNEVGSWWINAYTSK